MIIWKQIIKHASVNELKTIIFITDDNKADWWWKIDSSGAKTIGVRPELKDEIYREAKVEKFHIYNTGGFLSYVNEQLNGQVSKEAIKEVREISDERQELLQRHRMLRQITQSADKTVFEWLSHDFSHLVRRGHRDNRLDSVGYQDEHRYRSEIKLIHEPRSIMYRLQEMRFRYYDLLNEERFYEVAIIFVNSVKKLFLS